MIFCCCPNKVDFSCVEVHYSYIGSRWVQYLVDITGSCSPSEVYIEFSTEEELLSQLDPAGSWISQYRTPPVIAWSLVVSSSQPKTFFGVSYSTYLSYLNYDPKPTPPYSYVDYSDIKIIQEYY